MSQLWWVVPAALASLGYGLSLAGLTPAQRAVWVTARIVEVGQPEHGASKLPGIPVTVAFQDPDSGREFVLPNTGRHGIGVDAAWVGLELTVRYPRGRPDRFRVMLGTGDERGGRVVPNCTGALLAVGLVIHATVARGYPWALLGFGALLIAWTVTSGDLRRVRTRDALLSSAVAVPARVVAVAKDVRTDGEGDEIVNHAPVITFTTREGVHVTALSYDGIPDPGSSLGRELTIHYAPSDPAFHTSDPAAERRDNESAVGVIIIQLIAGLAAVVTGAATL